jgi:hypothetical protein
MSSKTCYKTNKPKWIHPPDDRGSIHLWNVGEHLLDKRQYIPEDSKLN